MGYNQDSLARKVGKRLDSIHGGLERGIAESLYRSAEQRRRRRGIVVALGIKHGLRGILFSWPLYLVGVAALLVPAESAPWLGVFLLPGVWLSVVILRRGVRDDYRQYVKGVILKPGALRHILFPHHHGS
ncbi:MAG: hypothetical protein ABFS23_06180 [Pseudomonadota bacterium]